MLEVVDVLSCDQVDFKSLSKVYWGDIRNKVAKVAPRFAEIVDNLDPDKSFPLYLAYYPYGAIDADTNSSLFPKSNGGYYRLSDSDVPKDVLEHLGYSINDTPFGMVLEKQIECFVDLKNSGMTIPRVIYTAGTINPLTTLLRNNNNRKYGPSNLLTSTAGSRSVYMLPNIGDTANHTNLQRDFNVKASTPKSIYEHWQIFKEIANSEKANSDWRCCVMYFSEKWIEIINNSHSWYELKQYVHEQAWSKLEYEMYRVEYDMIFSIIQQTHDLRPNPYLADIAKHLFSITIGASPGYVPASDNDALPLDLLQNAYAESYGLKKYIPTILQPSHYNFEEDKLPIYYSLLNLSTNVFSPKSRAVSNTSVELRELEHIMNVFIVELTEKNGMCISDSIMAKIARCVKFNYYHNKIDRHGIIRPSMEMLDHDPRLRGNFNEANTPTSVFSRDAQFVRGCIGI